LNRYIAVVLSASLQFDSSLVSVRYVDVKEFGLEGIFKAPVEETFDIGVLYGKVLGKGSLSFASIAAGISYVGGVKRGEFSYTEGIKDFYERIGIQTIGIPIELQLFVTFRLIGVGLYGFANINGADPLVGFAVCLQLGYLSDPVFPGETGLPLTKPVH
jgi:hypothetical protein